MKNLTPYTKFYPLTCLSVYRLTKVTIKPNRLISENAGYRQGFKDACISLSQESERIEGKRARQAEVKEVEETGFKVGVTVITLVAWFRENVATKLLRYPRELQDDFYGKIGRFSKGIKSNIDPDMCIRAAELLDMKSTLLKTITKVFSSSILAKPNLDRNEVARLLSESLKDIPADKFSLRHVASIIRLRGFTDLIKYDYTGNYIWDPMDKNADQTNTRLAYYPAMEPACDIKNVKSTSISNPNGFTREITSTMVHPITGEVLCKRTYNFNDKSTSYEGIHPATKSKYTIECTDKGERKVVITLYNRITNVPQVRFDYNPYNGFAGKPIDPITGLPMAVNDIEVSLNEVSILKHKFKLHKKS